MKIISRLHNIMGWKEPVKYSDVFYPIERENKKLWEKLKELDKRGWKDLTLEEKSELEQKYSHVKPRVFLQSVLGDILSYIKYFPKTNEYFVYNQDSGIFTQFNPMEFLSLLANMIANSPLASKVDPSNYSKEILRILIETESTHVGPPEVDFEYLSMKNGLLSLKDKKFTPHTPNVFLTSKVSYSYEPGATCPRFLNFLKNICGGQDDRVSLIRAWFHTVISGSKEAQVFFYLYGPAASGKTMLSNYLAALIGRDRVIYTTLKKLNTDMFELYNLRFKALIQISDSERYEADIPILKQLVGSDPIHASVKYVQGSFPLKHIGNLMIISNHEFKSKDNTPAIVRRIVPFCSSPRKLKEMAKWTPLIEPCPEHISDFKGPGVSELPGILNWVLEFDSDKSFQYLTQIKQMVPSFASIYQSVIQSVNPLSSWVSQRIKPCSRKITLMGLKNSREDTLYGNYVKFCNDEGASALNPRRFREDLVNYLGSLPEYRLLGTVLKETNQGLALTQVTFSDPVIYEEDSEGTPKETEEEISENRESKEEGVKETEGLLVLDEGWKNPITQEPSIVLDLKEEKVDKKQDPEENKKDWVQEYKKMLEYPKEGPLNEITKIKIGEGEIEKILENVLKDTKKETMDPGFKERLLKRLVRDAKIISEKGLMINKYDFMGASPRLSPCEPLQKYTVLSRKKEIKMHAYYMIKPILDSFFGKDGSLFDIDIKACYLNICLSVYKEQYKEMIPLVKEGLWIVLEKYFKEQGQGEQYNKKWAKIGVYSSFFQGGSNAMTKGILASIQKEIGMSDKVFEEWEGSNSYKNQVNKMVSILRKSPIIIGLRNASGEVASLGSKQGMEYKLYKTGVLYGPEKQQIIYPLVDFRLGFSEVLMTYEVQIIAQVMLRIKRKYPQLFVLGHFHDGVCFYVSGEDIPKSVLIEDLNLFAKEAGSLMYGNPLVTFEGIKWEKAGFS